MHNTSPVVLKIKNETFQQFDMYHAAVANTFDRSVDNFTKLYWMTPYCMGSAYATCLGVVNSKITLFDKSKLVTLVTDIVAEYLDSKPEYIWGFFQKYRETKAFQNGYFNAVQVFEATNGKEPDSKLKIEECFLNFVAKGCECIDYLASNLKSGNGCG